MPAASAFAGSAFATPVAADEAPERLESATVALDGYLRALDEHDAPPSRVADDLTAAVCLRRIIDASRPFV